MRTVEWTRNCRRGDEGISMTELGTRNHRREEVATRTSPASTRTTISRIAAFASGCRTTRSALAKRLRSLHRNSTTDEWQDDGLLWEFFDVFVELNLVYHTTIFATYDNVWNKTVFPIILEKLFNKPA